MPEYDWVCVCEHNSSIRAYNLICDDEYQQNKKNVVEWQTTYEILREKKNETD